MQCLPPAVPCETTPGTREGLQKPTKALSNRPYQLSSGPAMTDGVGSVRAPFQVGGSPDLRRKGRGENMKECRKTRIVGRNTLNIRHVGPPREKQVEEAILKDD